MKVAFLLNPYEDMKYELDTSFCMLREMNRRKHDVFVFRSQDLCAFGNDIVANLSPCDTDLKTGLIIGEGKRVLLKSIECIVIRKEPPFDMDYATSMHLLGKIRNEVYFMNDPIGILHCNEKISILEVPEDIPVSAVGYAWNLMSEFMEQFPSPEWIFKPLFFKGGRGLRRVKSGDPGSERLFNAMTQHGRTPIMIQHFIEHLEAGDKRIFVLGGKAIGAFKRLSIGEDFRTNMDLGGVSAPATILDAELKVIANLRPFLKENALDFVGLDFIRGKLTEINVTSPAGIPEVNRYEGGNLETTVIDFIERQVRLRAKKTNRKKR